MKICMIGCGDFARRFHGPAQQRCAREDPALELAACCDVDGKRAADYAAGAGYARHQTDLLAMLAAERPDAVILAVPPALTCEVASEVLSRGFPLLLEKPPGLSLAELTRLIAAAEKGRALAQVCFNRRYMPVFLRVREIFGTGFAATRIDYEMTRAERWNEDFSTTAVHAIDAVRFLADSPFRTARIDYQPFSRGTASAVGVTVEADCASGTKVRLEIQPVAGCNTESARIHALGQTLTLRIPYPGRTMVDGCLELWRGDEMVSAYTDHGLEAAERMGIVGETKAFLATVRSGGAAAPGLPDCRQQVHLMEAIRLRQTGPFDLPAA